MNYSTQKTCTGLDTKVEGLIDDLYTLSYLGKSQELIGKKPDVII